MNIFKKLKDLFKKEDDQPTITAFEMSADVACEYFELCEKRKAKTEKERSKVLNELAKKGKMSRVWRTKRSKDQFLNDLARNYKVLHIKSKEDKSE
jgi:muconolactone delta-isomerase